MAKFFIRSEDFTEEQAYIRGADAHHLQNVLRMRVGDKLEIAALGGSYEAEIAEMAPECVRLRVLRALVEDRESPIKVYLLPGISKGEKMDWIIEKATELGVYAVIPVMLQRCVVQLDAKAAEKKRERWQRLAEAAAKQCRRSHIPRIYQPCSLPEALAAVQGMPCIALWENEEELGYKEALRQTEGESVALLIGAEGGFEREEIELARSGGARTVSIGRRILRAETAAIAALTMCMYELADLGGAR